ncbi:MAG TPA: hypothetical protein VEV41_03845, partial [Terriglobales bacterium]|nr:hypothetical protein [Terriglobales bacterium]
VVPTFLLGLLKTKDLGWLLPPYCERQANGTVHRTPDLQIMSSGFFVPEHLALSPDLRVQTGNGSGEERPPLPVRLC